MRASTTVSASIAYRREICHFPFIREGENGPPPTLEIAAESGTAVASETAMWHRHCTLPMPQQQNHHHRTISNEFARQCESLIPAKVIMISGCHSEQTSADVHHVSCVAQLPDPAGRAGGACTSALLDLLYCQQQQQQPNNKKRQQQLTFQKLLLELRDILAKRGFDQIPQLTSSRPLDVTMQETPFSLRTQRQAFLAHSWWGSIIATSPVN